MAALILTGCVTRTLEIVSEPPGAEVFLDGRAVGTTPYTETFLSYGVRRVDLRLAGHDRIVAPIDVERPWWQFPLISLISDLLVPFPLLDEHHFRFELRPMAQLPSSWEDARAVHERLLAHKRRMVETWPELAEEAAPGPPPAADAP